MMRHAAQLHAAASGLLPCLTSKCQLDVRHASVALWLLPQDQLGAAGCCKLVTCTLCTAMKARLCFGPKAAWGLLLHLASFSLKAPLMLASLQFACRCRMLFKTPQMHACCGYSLYCAARGSFICGSEADQLCCLHRSLSWRATSSWQSGNSDL